MFSKKGVDKKKFNSFNKNVKKSEISVNDIQYGLSTKHSVVYGVDENCEPTICDYDSDTRGILRYPINYQIPGTPIFVPAVALNGKYTHGTYDEACEYGNNLLANAVNGKTIETAEITIPIIYSMSHPIAFVVNGGPRVTPINDYIYGYFDEFYYRRNENNINILDAFNHFGMNSALTDVIGCGSALSVNVHVGDGNIKLGAHTVNGKPKNCPEGTPDINSKTLIANYNNTHIIITGVLNVKETLPEDKKESLPYLLINKCPDEVSGGLQFIYTLTGYTIVFGFGGSLTGDFSWYIKLQSNIGFGFTFGYTTTPTCCGNHDQDECDCSNILWECWYNRSFDVMDGTLTVTPAIVNGDSKNALVKCSYLKEFGN
jgi:hypothetical protein